MKTVVLGYAHGANRRTGRPSRGSPVAVFTLGCLVECQYPGPILQIAHSNFMNAPLISVSGPLFLDLLYIACVFDFIFYAVRIAYLAVN